MKGIVFSFNRRTDYTKGRSRRYHNYNVKQFLALYGISFLFFTVFLLGTVLGFIYLRSASAPFVKKLDFMFVTNLENRLKFSVFEIFATNFLSDFIFILSACMLGFCAWGSIALPFLCAFNGTGVGISCAYIIYEHSYTGAGFYILVILPGLVLFLLAFILALKESFSLSVSMLKSFFVVDERLVLRNSVKPYFFRFSIILVFTIFSALIDMITWVLFANLFNLGV